LYKDIIEQCIYCKSLNIDSMTETGYIVCVDCGSILNTIISEELSYESSNQNQNNNPFSPI